MESLQILSTLNFVAFFFFFKQENLYQSVLKHNFYQILHRDSWGEKKIFKFSSVLLCLLTSCEPFEFITAQLQNPEGSVFISTFSVVLTPSLSILCSVLHKTKSDAFFTAPILWSNVLTARLLCAIKFPCMFEGEFHSSFPLAACLCGIRASGAVMSKQIWKNATFPW